MEYDEEFEYEEEVFEEEEQEEEYWIFFDNLKELCETTGLLNNCRYVDLHQFIYYNKNGQIGGNWLMSSYMLYGERREEAPVEWIKYNEEILINIYKYIKSFFEEIYVEHYNVYDIVNFIYSYS